jgi:predicted HicB family RNase H-like nuclease
VGFAKMLSPPYRLPDARRGDPAKKPTMKDEYDFSKAERGKFFRRDAQLDPPLHLDPEVLSYLAKRAEARGISLNRLVNELLKKDIELIEATR